MNRSQKIRCFYYGNDRKAKMIAIAYTRSIIDVMTSAINKDCDIDIKRARQMLTQERKLEETLERQCFILDNPTIPFEIRKTGYKRSEPLYFSKHRLYLVILKDDEEALFLLSRSPAHHK